MRLAEGVSVQDHIKSLTELCDEVAAIGESVKELSVLQALVTYKRLSIYFCL
jgi:uncharacterized protein YaaR (DUF327 family)